MTKAMEEVKADGHEASGRIKKREITMVTVKQTERDTVTIPTITTADYVINTVYARQVET